TEPGIRERLREEPERVREEVLVKLAPVDVTRELLGRGRVETFRRLEGRESNLARRFLTRRGAVRRLEGLERLVFVAEKRAINRDRVGVVVLVVGTVAKVERALVVDLHHHDRSVRPLERRERGRERPEVARGLVVERARGVARNRKAF